LLEKELQKVKAENDTLSDTIQFARMEKIKVSDKNLKLEAEIAQLKEKEAGMSLFILNLFND
jgi:predicted  nucleic acid-binding Zn-ribbon protein